MKKIVIALAAIMFVCANVYAAPSNVAGQNRTASAQQSGQKKASVVSKKKAKEAKAAAAKAAAKAAQKEAAAAKANRKASATIARAEKKYGTDTVEGPATVMARIDEMESMILSTDAVESMKTVEEQTVQDVEETLSPSAPTRK